MELEKLLTNTSWKSILKDEFKKEYFLKIDQVLSRLYEEKTIYPKKEDLFSSLNHCDFENVKVVIIGQDPYHGKNQAHGMCFSVQRGIKIPPSLVNIYKEIESDLKIKMPDHGYLKSWADQGVLLLNSILSVEEGKPMSHKDLDWEIFTDKIIELINEKKENVVFLLWGAPAQKKAKNVDERKHYVLKSVHPSPLSSYRGFFGCKHFSKCNQYLIKMGMTPINWQIS